MNVERKIAAFALAYELLDCYDVDESDAEFKQIVADGLQLLDKIIEKEKDARAVNQLMADWRVVNPGRDDVSNARLRQIAVKAIHKN
jgi:hypothetical protein